MSAGGTDAVVSEYGALPIGTIGYHVDMLSWLSSSRRVTVGPGHTLEVTLDRLINPTTSNPLLAILPINGSHDHFYTVEVRDIFAIYDQNVPARAVIIHRVDKTMKDNGGHAMVVDDDDDGDEPLIDSNDEGAQWQPGEYFFDSVNKIRIEVLASSGTTYRVRLSNRPVPPAKVNIVSAPAITSSRRPTVAWNSVPNADRYTVEFLMNNVIVHANTVTGTSYTPPGALQDGTYSVRVRALNALGQAGPNSEPRSVTIDTVPPANPQKVSPASGAEVRTFTPTFCWQRVPDAAVYEVSWQPYQSARTTSTCYTMPRQLVEGQQWWNVIACDQAGNCGSWVDAFPYTIVSPANSAPRVVRQGTNPRLTWNPQDWALGYEVQIATNSSFTALYGSYSLPANVLSMTVNDMPAGTYYWRIRIKSGATTWSPWSQPEMIVVR
jgi:hypothetical protein